MAGNSWGAAAVALLLATSAMAAEPALLRGTVTKVRDGDTIEVDGVAVRLQGVAAPERREPLGRLATQAMTEFVRGQQVVCRPNGTRSRDRIVAVCELAGVDLGAYLVRRGLARDCPRYSGGAYAALEASLGEQSPVRRLYPLPNYCREPIARDWRAGAISSVAADSR